MEGTTANVMLDRRTSARAVDACGWVVLVLVFRERGELGMGTYLSHIPIISDPQLPTPGSFPKIMFQFRLRRLRGRARERWTSWSLHMHTTSVRDLVLLASLASLD